MNSREITVVGLYNQVPQAGYILDQFPAKQAYSVRRLSSRCTHAIMVANVRGKTQQVYAVDFPRHPPKRKRIIKKWRKRYASEDCQLELVRLGQNKIVNRNREWKRLNLGVVLNQYFEQKLWEHTGDK